MDCRETRRMLSAYHDGELSPAERAGVEEHLRGCAGCSGLLAALSGFDSKVEVPDPGPEYWERFNRRVVERAAKDDGGKKQTARPKQGWVRRQLPYFVPVAAAAALAVAIIRHAGLGPFSPSGSPPPREIARLDQETAPLPVPPTAADGNVPRRSRGIEQGRIAAREEAPPSRTASIPQELGKAAPAGAAPAAPAVPSPRPLPESLRAAPPSLDRKGAARQEREAAPATVGETSRFAADTAEGKGIAAGAKVETGARGKARGSAAPMPAPSPCESARSLALEGRLKEAEAAQRACLARHLPPASRGSGLVFLAELLDRQSRFAEADEVLRDAQRRYPESRPLDDYLRVRTQVQNRQLPVDR